MPEIWIPYGNTETLITLKAENMGDLVERGKNQDTLELPEIPENCELYLLDDLNSTTELIGKLEKTIVEKRCHVFTSRPEKLAKVFPDLSERVSEIKPLGKMEKEKTELPELKNTVFISTVLPDPIFGILDPKVLFASKLVTGFNETIYEKDIQFEPRPAKKNEFYEAAERICEQLKSVFIGVIPYKGKLNCCFTLKDFENSLSKIETKKIKRTKGLIVSPGGYQYDEFLSDSIRYACNCISSVDQKGVLCLVSECSRGLGSKAIELLITNRLSKRNRKYIEGIEYLYLLEYLKSNFEILLLSCLPEVYVRQRLGLECANSSSDAVSKMISKMQKQGKINVITNSAEIATTSNS